MSHLQEESLKSPELLERLRIEHRRLDEQVNQLESQRWLSPEEEAEVKRLKRLKLAKKDQLRIMGEA